MDLLLNVLLAWTSVVLAFLAVIVWLLRILIKKKIISPRSFLGKTNRKLRVSHIGIGIAFVITSILHAMFSSEAVFSLNYGTVVIVLAILLGAMFLIKSKVQRQAWLTVHRTLTVMLIVFFGIHIYDIGGAPATKQLIETFSGTSMVVVESEQLLMLTEEMKTDISSEPSIMTFEDGVYTGVADGYGEDLTVEVTVKNGIITNIDIVSHNEVGERFYEESMIVIPKAIIESQTIAVDSVSGSTFTSIGIKNAVADALLHAFTSGELLQQDELLIQEELLQKEELPEERDRHGGLGGGNRRGQNKDEEGT